MSFSIVYTDLFAKELKQLAKKFPSIKQDVSDLVTILLIDPRTGTKIGNDCYKIRIAIKSKGKGKSGGARVITHIQVSKETLYLISIYDKSELENVSEGDIIGRIEKLKRV